MKPLLPAIAAIAAIALAGCGDDRPEPTHAQDLQSHQRAAGEADKSFDKENPANPGQFSDEKKP